MIKSVEELINIIERKDIYIFGAGFVGERFLHGLSGRGYLEHVKGFVVTNVNNREFCGEKVISVNELQRIFDINKDYICIATHEAVKDQVENELELLGLSEHVWIYPFLHEICFGRPIQKNVIRSTKSLLVTYKDDYAVPIRYLAIEQFNGKNNVGYGLYIKGMNLHCSKNVANKRLETFIQLIKKWTDYGYDKKHTIKLTHEGEIIDGLHRLTVACYYNCEELICDIYHVDRYERFIDGNVRINKDKLNLFTKNEWKELERVRQILVERIQG